MPNHKIYKTTEFGIEKLCPKCKEWWPYDLYFFYKQKGHLSSWCKACVSVQKKEYYNRVSTNPINSL